MKHLFITLEIQDGERSHTHHCLHVTKAENINFAAERYAAEYWGESYREGDRWMAHGGEIAIRWTKVKLLTKRKYNELWNLFY